MPNFSDFKQIDGEIYCWNSDIEEYIHISFDLINDSIKYKRVIAAYKNNRNTMEKLDDANKDRVS